MKSGAYVRKKIIIFYVKEFALFLDFDKKYFAVRARRNKDDIFRASISPSPRAARTQPVATPPQSSCVDPPCRKERFRGAAVSHGKK
jgi:hypothetical protein